MGPLGVSLRTVSGFRLTCLVLLTLAPVAARGAVGGPDCFGYTWADNASGCAQGVPGFGAGAQTFTGVTAPVMQPLGFSIAWYGRLVSDIWISPTGYVTFSDQGGAAQTTQAFPDPAGPNDLLAVYWLPAAEADITVESAGSTFHVRWQQLPNPAIPTLRTDVHLVISSDGTFRMVWPNVVDLFGSTIGHEDPTGSCGRVLFRDGMGENGNFPTPGAGGSACIQSPVLLDCSSPTVVQCNESLPASLPAALPTAASVYSCSGVLEEGNEAVFEVQVATPSEVTVSIDNAGLDLLQMGTPCREGNCLAWADSQITLPVAFPGSYLFVVDKPSPGGGDAFTFTVDCADPFRAVSCGETIAGDTRGRNGVRQTYSCSGVALDGPEEYYRVTLPAQDTLVATLTTAEANLWVLIFDAAAFDAGTGTCLAAGRGGAGIFDAPAGDYVVVVDGQAGAASDYVLGLSCGLQMDCAAATPVSCAQTVSGDTTGMPSNVGIYSCVNEVLVGGEMVYTFFNPIEQTITASFISNQPGQKLLLLPACDEGTCFLAGDAGVSCALFPPGDYILVVDGTDSGAFEFEILCSEFALGVDLRVTAIDASGLGGSCEDFDVGGTARVRVTNLGTSTASAPFEVVVFEDRAVSGDLEEPGDNVLGRTMVMSDVPPGATATVDVPAAGTLLFRDNVIYAKADTGSAVPEIDETNNLFDTARACEFRPPIGEFTPEVEWHWMGSAVEPTFDSVDTVPLVADMNLDGLPDVVFNAAPSAGGNRAPSVIRCIAGDGSGDVWTADDPMARAWGRSQPALGDIDDDGRPEVVVQSGVDSNRLVFIDDDGSYMYLSDAFLGFDYTSPDFGGGGPSMADLNCDGNVEIIFAHNVFNADGTHFWTPEAGGTIGANVGTFGPDCPISVAADVNGDGQLDVVAGPTVYEWNPATGMGEILWNNAAVADGHPALGNFDGDDLPEIAITGNGTVYLLEGDTGAIIWQRRIPTGGGGCGAGANISGGPPTVADFDGDCAAEVGVAGADWYVVLETDGTVKWQAPINDCSSHRTASSVFDFDGDGAAEVAFMEQRTLHVFAGIDGTQVASLPATSHTWIEMIAIADVDADNNAEIIVPLNRGGGAPAGEQMWGIQAIGDADDNWVNTRRIWNQHQYHISHVNDDGTIPGPAEGCQRDSWRIHNTFRDQIGSAIYAAPDLTISILETEIILNPDCFRSLRIVARAGNGGGINVGRVTAAWFFEGDPAAGGTPLTPAVVPDLAPGEFVDFEVTVDFPRFGSTEIYAVVDDDGMGGGQVNECREDNNICVVTIVNDPVPIDPPTPVGPALRATGHGDPTAADITGDFEWSGDLGGPRDLGMGLGQEHYHVLRGTQPTALGPAPGTEPWLGTSWTDSTMRGASRPHVHFYRVLAADNCDQVEQ